MNEPTQPPSHCPKCGAALGTDAPEGLCPRCLSALPLGAETVLDEDDVKAAGLPLSPEELAPHFPQLEILECLGRGGMGVVYKARQKSLNRLVALKLLAPERAGDPQFAARFEKEAHALAALNHPNIVAVYDFGQAGGFYFLLMEFVDGVNLRQLLQAKKLTPKEALSIVPPICEALQCAHDRGIVHRDIKPENLLIDKTGTVKIADFGIAKMVGDGTHGMEAAQAGNPAHGSVAIGTPDYAAPEQRSANAATDHRADIYSLGVVLYEMLTGERPKENIVPPSKRVLVDVRIDEIVLRALEKTPALRFSTASEFRTQVEMLATPAAASSRSGESRFIKAGIGALTTPDRLATFEGQFFGYRDTRGQIILDDRQFTHSCAGTNTVIPLAAIRDVSIGRHPRAMAPAGIDLISVTYEEGGQRKQVLLFPIEGWFGLASTANARVAEWHAAIRDAVTSTTGNAPTVTPKTQLHLPGSNVGMLLCILGVPLAVGLILIGFILCFRRTFTPLESVTVPAKVLVANHNATFLLIGIAMTAALGFFVWRSSKKPSETVPADHPPRFSRNAIVGACWALFIFILSLAVWWLVGLRPVIALGFVAQFGTTILGWIAVSQIRRSAGKIRGLGLAVFDGVLFPLLVLDGLIGWLSFFLTRLLVDFYANPSVVGDPRINPPFLTRLANDLAQQGTSSTLLTIATVLEILIVDFLIIRAVWRAVSPDVPEASENTVTENL